MRTCVIAEDSAQAKINAKLILKNEGYRNIEILNVKEAPIESNGLDGAKVYFVEYNGLYHKQEQINVDLLKKERNDVLKLYKQMKKLTEQKSALDKKMEKITKKCDHRIVVQTRNEMSDNDYYVDKEVRCLLCNKQFSSIYDVDFDDKFDNIIHFENMDVSSTEKIELAFNMFCEIKEENPELSDSEIVDKINNSSKQKVKK